MGNVRVVAILIFCLLRLSIADCSGFSQLDEPTKGLVENQHIALRDFIALRPEHGEGVKSSDRSSTDSSVGSANTLGAFRLVICKGKKLEVLTPVQDVLYTSRALHSEANEDAFLPCLDQMDKHWRHYCPLQGKCVRDAATGVFKLIEDKVKRSVEEMARELERSPKLEKLQPLIDTQRKFCAVKSSDQWQMAVSFLEGEDFQKSVSAVVGLKDVDTGNLKRMKLTELRDDRQVGEDIKSFVSTIVKHGWHAEQRMLFKAGELLQAKFSEIPERVVMCLYTDNAPCHSFGDDGKESQKRNQCRCRKTLDNLSQKRFLGEAFDLGEHHPLAQVPFTLTVSFSYKYDMDSVSDDDKNNFGKWLFYLNSQGKMQSWTECPQSKKDVKMAAEQSEGTASSSDKIPTEDKQKKATKRAKVPDESRLQVNLEEIDGMHSKLVGNRECECSSPAEKWKHVKDIIKDMGHEQVPATAHPPANSNSVPSNSDGLNKDVQEIQNQPKKKVDKCCSIS